MVLRQPRPLVVRHHRALALRLAPGAAALATPIHERELSLLALPLHDSRGARRSADVRALHSFSAQLRFRDLRPRARARWGCTARGETAGSRSLEVAGATRSGTKGAGGFAEAPAGPRGACGFERTAPPVRLPAPAPRGPPSSSRARPPPLSLPEPARA